MLLTLRSLIEGVLYSQNVNANLNFTGAAGRATMTRLSVAVLSTIGSLVRFIQRNNSLAILVFAGTTSKGVARPMTAVLSLTGSLAKTVKHGLSAALTFTGSQIRNAVKGFAAIASFTGTRRVAVTTGLTGAALSFAGTAAKLFGRPFAGVLSFAGALSSTKFAVRVLNATLSFTGSQARAVTKGATAVLSFTGTRAVLVKKGLTVAVLSLSGAAALRTVKGLSAAVLSFTATLGSGKFLVRALSGVLSFTGSIVTSHTFGRLLSAVLSFAGAMPRQTGHQTSGAVSFSGAQVRAIKTSLSIAIASFTATLPRLTRKQLAGAAISFVGVVQQGGKIVLMAFVATISFAGAAPRIVQKRFDASIGLFAKLFNGALELFPRLPIGKVDPQLWWDKATHGYRIGRGRSDRGRR